MPLTPTEKRVLDILQEQQMRPSSVVKQLSSTGSEPEDVRAAIWHLVDAQAIELTPDLVLRPRSSVAA